MSALDSRIDELYQKPLGEFTAARNALAKALGGEDAERVRKLPKPTVVPWTVNQLYWRDRRTFDRLRTSGARLRAAQIAALKGRSTDLRAASDSHRNTVAEAAQHAARLAAQAGSSPDADELSRTLEALSLAQALPEPPGRLTRSLQPAGFEALAGIVPGAPAVSIPRQQQAPARRQPPKTAVEAEAEARRAAAAQARQIAAERRKAERDARRRAAETQKAEAALDRAEAVEAKARVTWERAKRSVDEARGRLDALRRTPSRSS